MAIHKHRNGANRVLTGVAVKLTSSVPTNDIADGDLVGIESNKAVPIGAFTWNTDEATTRAAFRAAYLGISRSRSRAATTDARDLTIQVNTDGFYEMACSSATYEIGDLLGPNKASGNALLNTVKKVTVPEEAVAIVVARGTTVTTVLAQLINTVATRLLPTDTEPVDTDA